jgi:hypothetical protein
MTAYYRKQFLKKHEMHSLCILIVVDAIKDLNWEEETCLGNRVCRCVRCAPSWMA